MTSYNNYPTGSSDPVERYKYLLRTASPDQIEQVHEQAFAQMSAEDRQKVLEALAGTAEAPKDDSPATLARSATRLEMQQPGALDKVLGGFTGSAGGSLLGSVAAGFAGSALYNLLFGANPRGGILSNLWGRLTGRGGYGYGYNQAPPPPQQGGLFGNVFGGGGPGRGGFGGGPGGGFGEGGFGGGPGGGFGGGPGGGGFGGGPGGGGPGGPH